MIHWLKAINKGTMNALDCTSIFTDPKIQYKAKIFQVGDSITLITGENEILKVAGITDLGIDQLVRQNLELGNL